MITNMHGNNKNAKKRNRIIKENSDLIESSIILKDFVIMKTQGKKTKHKTDIIK